MKPKEGRRAAEDAKKLFKEEKMSDEEEEAVDDDEDRDPGFEAGDSEVSDSSDDGDESFDLMSKDGEMLASHKKKKKLSDEIVLKGFGCSQGQLVIYLNHSLGSARKSSVCPEVVTFNYVARHLFDVCHLRIVTSKAHKIVNRLSELMFCTVFDSYKFTEINDDEFLPVARDQHSMPYSTTASKHNEAANATNSCKSSTLSLFDADTDNLILNCGGIVNALCWCPVPFDSQFQLLAIVSHSPQHPTKCFPTVRCQPSKSKGIIQFWMFHPNSPSPKKPKVLFCLCHSFGNIVSMKWLPVAPFPSHKQNVLCYLLLACQDGFVRIISVPFPSQHLLQTAQTRTTPMMLQIENCLRLGISLFAPESSDTLAYGFPTCIDVNIKFPHIIAAGFSSGKVAVWFLHDIIMTNGTEKTNYLVKGYYYFPALSYRNPTHVFQADPRCRPILCIKLDPLTARVVAVSMFQRNLVYFDLNCLNNDSYGVKDNLGSVIIRDMAWTLRGDYMVTIKEKVVGLGDSLELSHPMDPRCVNNSYYTELDSVEDVGWRMCYNNLYNSIVWCSATGVVKVQKISFVSPPITTVNVRMDAPLPLKKSGLSRSKEVAIDLFIKQLGQCSSTVFRASMAERVDEASQKPVCDTCKQSGLMCVECVQARCSLNFSSGSKRQHNLSHFYTSFPAHMIQSLSWNDNPLASDWIALGMNSGLVKLVKFDKMITPDIQTYLDCYKKVVAEKLDLTDQLTHCTAQVDHFHHQFNRDFELINYDGWNCMLMDEICNTKSRQGRTKKTKKSDVVKKKGRPAKMKRSISNTAQDVEFPVALQTTDSVAEKNVALLQDARSNDIILEQETAKEVIENSDVASSSAVKQSKPSDVVVSCPSVVDQTNNSVVSSVSKVKEKTPDSVKVGSSTINTDEQKDVATVILDSDAANIEHDLLVPQSEKEKLVNANLPVNISKIVVTGCSTAAESVVAKHVIKKTEVKGAFSAYKVTFSKFNANTAASQKNLPAKKVQIIRLNNTGSENLTAAPTEKSTKISKSIVTVKDNQSKHSESVSVSAPLNVSKSNKESEVSVSVKSKVSSSTTVTDELIDEPTLNLPSSTSGRSFSNKYVSTVFDVGGGNFKPVNKEMNKKIDKALSNIVEAQNITSFDMIKLESSSTSTTMDVNDGPDAKKNAKGDRRSKKRKNVDANEETNKSKKKKLDLTVSEDEGATPVSSQASCEQSRKSKKRVSHTNTDNESKSEKNVKSKSKKNEDATVSTEVTDNLLNVEIKEEKEIIQTNESLDNVSSSKKKSVKKKKQQEVSNELVELVTAISGNDETTRSMLVDQESEILNVSKRSDKKKKKQTISEDKVDSMTDNESVAVEDSSQSLPKSTKKKQQPVIAEQSFGIQNSKNKSRKSVVKSSDSLVKVEENEKVSKQSARSHSLGSALADTEYKSELVKSAGYLNVLPPIVKSSKRKSHAGSMSSVSGDGSVKSKEVKDNIKIRWMDSVWKGTEQYISRAKFVVAPQLGHVQQLKWGKSKSSKSKIKLFPVLVIELTENGVQKVFSGKAKDIVWDVPKDLNSTV